MAKRRPNGEGHYRKHPNGSWEWQVMIGRDLNGQPIRKSFFANTKKEARRIGEDYIEEYGSGTKGLNGFTPFSKWADKWYAYIKGTVTMTTYESYKYTLKIIKDYFKDTLFRTKDQKISIVGKSKLLDFPTMPTTAESLPLLISFCIH